MHCTITVAVFETRWRRAAMCRGLPAPPTAANIILQHACCAIADTTAAGGNVPAAFLTNQLAVMNQQAKFGGTAFNFVLAGTERTVNASWFGLEVDDMANRYEVEMKTALQKGGKVGRCAVSETA